MQAATPCLEVNEALVAIGGETLQVCFQCGTCTAVCPWNLVRTFSPRKMIRLAQLGLEGFESEDLWNCVTCNQCVLECPRGVNTVDIVRAMRALMAETGSLPASFKVPLGSLASRGNPWGGEREARAEWARGLEVAPFLSGCEFLYFPCCTSAYDPRGQKVARSTASLLQRAGVLFGILGGRENCCGDPAGRMGDGNLFNDLALANLKTLQNAGVRQIVVDSPHCFHAFAKQYPPLGGTFQVFHTTQLYLRLLEEGRLKPRRKINLRVAYHDPCYLGRHQGIYEPPRRVLSAVPGLELVEMARNRENSLCCGGGGGGLWREVPAQERFSLLRLQEAESAGARVLAVACPYCLAMFEDAVKTAGKSGQIQVKDVSELLLESVMEPPKD